MYHDILCTYTHTCAHIPTRTITTTRATTYKIQQSEKQGRHKKKPTSAADFPKITPTVWNRFRALGLCRLQG